MGTSPVWIQEGADGGQRWNRGQWQQRAIIPRGLIGECGDFPWAQQWRHKREESKWLDWTREMCKMGTVQAEDLGEKKTGCYEWPQNRLPLYVLTWTFSLYNTVQGLANGRNHVTACWMPGVQSAAGRSMALKSDLTNSSLCDLLAYVSWAVSSSVTGRSPGFGLSPYRTVLPWKKEHFEKRYEEQRQRTEVDEDREMC